MLLQAAEMFVFIMVCVLAGSISLFNFCLDRTRFGKLGTETNWIFVFGGFVMNIMLVHYHSAII